MHRVDEEKQYKQRIHMLRAGTILAKPMVQTMAINTLANLFYTVRMGLSVLQ